MLVGGDFNLQAKETPSDGVITGYGVIDGNLVYVYSQDATVLKGAVGEMHARKIANIYDMAMKMGILGCIGNIRTDTVQVVQAFLIGIIIFIVGRNHTDQSRPASSGSDRCAGSVRKPVP